ncbi:hypothetical protein F5J12DRAFT_900457 [Pisolithus orientalis]|uniref:uncharacterized protein n=1 Tax=Pisolithus orientalis TaxID=936130 RepID=UPI0022247915|nr:uncharacterized protein F5J12DRAFT_900457 [Pisolithus orientalis]KAI5982157.1 hypothetical protein F5J12DRAFT_900457 [Pisolithus orientalis]
MSSTNQNQTKSNNNNSKSGKRTAVPQPPRPTGVSTGTDVAAAINLSHAQSTAAHKRLAARKATKVTAPEGEEGGEMDVEQATAPKGKDGGEMDMEQATAPEGEDGGAMDVEQVTAPESEEGGEMDVEQVTAPEGEEGGKMVVKQHGGKKSPKKNSKKRGHQDEVEETAGTETGGVSEAVSQSKRQKKAHKGSTRAQMPPPKEILTRKRGPKASKGKGKVTTTEDEWEPLPVASGSNVPVEKAEQPMVYQHKASKTGETKKIFPKLSDRVILSKDVVPNVKKTELTEADLQSMANEKALADLSLGYALMTTIRDKANERCDLERGPILRLREYNPRPLNDRYLVQLKNSISLRGLQNKVVWNAMVVAVPPAVIDLGSLRPVQLGTYTNHVRWTAEVAKHEASFLNGNHRREVMKLMTVQRTHVQYTKGVQLTNSIYGEEHKDKLEDLMDEATMELERSGSWLVHFINKDKLDVHTNRTWLLENLSGNTPAVTLPDDDDDKLYQVLNILATLENDRDAKEKYVEEVRRRAGSTRVSRLSRILADEELYTSVMKLMHLKHFQGGTVKSKLDTGFTTRQLESWQCSTGGIQLLLCEYVLDIFKFLAAPIPVPTLTSVREHAGEGELKDKECRKVAREMWALTMRSPYFAWEIVNEYANVWGSAWADVTKKHMDGNPWRLWAVNDEISQGKWENLVTQYFQRLASLATIEGQNVTLRETTSDDDKVRATVHAKLEWVHEGYMLRTGHPSSFKALPIGNKLMFNNIQRLFHDPTGMPKIDLGDIIKEVVCWVEPFFALACQQRGDRVWRDASRAWIANASRCGPSSEKVIAMIGDFLCQERPHLLMAQSYLTRNNVDMRAYTLGKLPTIITDKEFLGRVEANIKAYQEQVESWTRATRPLPYLRPAPNQSVDFEGYNFENQTIVAKGIIDMMRVTAFPKAMFKGTAQLVKALAPLILDKACREQLLGTTVVWELRRKVQGLMQFCGGVPKDSWTWWDGIQEQPEVHFPMDKYDTLAPMKNETTDNRAVRMALEHELHVKNKAKVATVVKTLFSEGLGVMKNGQVSPDLYDAAKRCLELAILESERHVAQLADPLEDVEGMKFSNAMWETYEVKMPPRADDDTTTSCWGPQEGRGLDSFRKAGTFVHGDRELLAEEAKLKAKEGRQLKKEMSEVEKARVFQPRGAHMKKLSARVARINQRKNAQDDECHVADFDKRMEEEERLATVAAAKLTETLKGLSFKKIDPTELAGDGEGETGPSTHDTPQQTTPDEWEISQLEEDEPTAAKSGKKNQRGLAVVKGTCKAKTGKCLLEGLEKDVKLGKRLQKKELTAAEAKAVRQSLKGFLDTEAIAEGSGSEDETSEDSDGENSFINDDSASEKGEEGGDEEEERSGSENVRIPDTESNPGSGTDDMASECGTGSDAESE